MRICSLKNLKAKNTDLDQYFQANSVSIDPLQLYDITGKQGWFIGNPAEFQLKKKIESNGKPLKDWDIKIYRGVLTGLNEAFIINTAKRDELIQLDPKSSDIIKPILRGRDIKRYGYKWADLWVINTHNGYKSKIPLLRGGNKVDGVFPAIDINDYPFVKAHLDQFQPALTNRSDQGKTSYNMRNCAYLEEFNKEKVVYPETTLMNNFCFAPQGVFIEKTGFIIVGNNLKYILGIFASKFFEVVFRKFFAGITLGEKGYQLNKDYLSKFPIPILDTTHKQELARQIEVIVEQILLVKSKNPHLEGVATQTTGVLESQIDSLVYQLYDLTADEIAVVESEN